MKTVKFIVAVVFTALIGTSVYAQTGTKTETVKVMGKCESCKARIEKAAKINGVTSAEWSDETKILTLVYDPAKVTSDEIQKKIAAVGHDTEKFKADDKTYNSLPGCCKYR